MVRKGKGNWVMLKAYFWVTGSVFRYHFGMGGVKVETICSTKDPTRVGHMQEKYLNYHTISLAQQFLT